ncbi:MAG TPA: amino acid ABC transporter substrate-binding protein [Candidatus Methylomirabilis sp.]|nr:amino acid ABC transporter substrate-binding protein [Candidatus Methylomirabilis sp.]HSC72248.1 amino acid ABC transporter substrate-binding protein [Candidatus Methylomirabilis sp.]
MQRHGVLRQWIGLFAIGLLVGAGSAWAADDTIVLGSAISQTGKYAREGKFYVDAYTLTVDAINKGGGVKVGGKSYKLALKLYDDQSDPNQCVRLYTRLVTSDKVNFLLGPYSSGITIPASSVAEKYETPMIQGGGASEQIFNRGYKYIFGTLPKAEFYFQSVIEAATKLTPRVQTAALLYSNEAFDRSVAEGSRQWLKEQKLDKLYDEEYQPATQDFTSILAVLKSKNPDLVLLAGHVENSLNFIRQAQAADFSPKMWAFTVGPPTADFRTALGRTADYAYGITPWLADMEVGGEIFKSAKEFAQQFQARFGYAADYHVASGAADVLIYKHAIEKANSLDPKKVRDAIAGIDVETLYGRVKFEPTGQIAMGQVLIQIQEGKVVPVYAAGKFAAKPMYPMPKWSQRK